MRLVTIALAAAGALIMVPALSAGPVLAATSAAAVTHTWGSATEVPGIAALNSGTSAGTESVSCPTSGNCSAGGFYTDSAINLQAFVVTQVGGTWGQAIEVPGLGALNSGGVAEVFSVSCASAGNCTAGGIYQDSSRVQHAFVVTEAGGAWGQAIEVPGTAALGTNADVTSVSCTAPGDCTAGGSYVDSSGQTQPFAATQTGGTWGQAVGLSGTATAGATVRSVSCTAAGTCTLAGGTGTDGSSTATAFVAAERSGVWSNAQPVPGLAALDAGHTSAAVSVSCSSGGNCATGGYYTDGAGSQQPFLATERNGVWGQAAQVAGLAGLGGVGGQVNSVACTSAGNCMAGGTSTGSTGVTGAFAVLQSGGVWGSAQAIPGLSTLNKGYAGVDSVSCASAGNCALGGFYGGGHDPGNNRPWVANQTGGVLRTAQRVPGIAALNVAGGASKVLSVSCARGGSCALGGYYSNPQFEFQAFVDSQE